MTALRDRVASVAANPWGRAALTVAVLATLAVSVAVARAIARDGAPPSAPAPTAVAIAPAPTEAPLPPAVALPAGCVLFDQFTWGSPRAGEPVAVSFVASACATRALDALDDADAALTLDLRRWNDDPTSPPPLTTTLPAGLADGRLVWRGELTFAQHGAWRPTLRVAGLEQPAGAVAVDAGARGFVDRPGLPAPSAPGEQLVVTLDGEERARWPAADAAGTAWLVDPERTVFVQSRAGVSWVVAGDPATGSVEPLFEAGQAGVSLVGSPAGNAFAVFGVRAPYTLRVYAAADGVVRAVDMEGGRYPVLAWSPDGETLVIVDSWLRVLAGDGRLRSARQLSGSGGGRVLWSPDGAYALVQTWDGVVYRVDHDAADAAVVFDARGTLRLDELAISPDGTRVAVVYTNESERAHRLAVVPASEPRLDGALAAHVVLDVAYEQHYGWLQSPAWSPDGRSIALTHGFSPAPGGASQLRSAVIRVDVDGGASREVRVASEGYYLWAVSWTADGSALFAGRASCYACDGGTAAFDLVEATSGRLIASVAGGFPLGSAGDARIVTGETLALFDGAGRVRPLMPAAAGRSEVRATATSPGGLVAVALGPGAGAVLAVDPMAADDVRPAVIGVLDRFVEPLALLDDRTVLGASGSLALYDLAGGAKIPLEPEGSEHGMVSVSPDRRRALLAQRGGATLRVLELPFGDVTRPALGLEHGSRAVPAWTSDSAQFALLDGPALVIIDLAHAAAVTRVDLAGAGLPRAEDGALRALALAWADPAHVDVLTDDGVWRVEARAGGAARRLAPLPESGLTGMPVLTRSPDGRTLVLVSAFGAYALAVESGTWRELSRAGVTEWLPAPWGGTALWAPDSSALAYAARSADGADDLGVIVVPVDGSGAFLLLLPALGRLTSPLAWIEDGRIVYAVFAQGI